MYSMQNSVHVSVMCVQRFGEMGETEELVWNFTGGLGKSEETFRKEWCYLKNGRNYEVDLVGEEGGSLIYVGDIR